jgi:trans-aconitate methyltransferase
MSQAWSPSAYARDARFVSELATPVVELLSPRPGERILDLGCGDGVLSRKLADMGCIVIGVDSSPDMIKAAVKLGLDARVVDGQELAFCEEFDAVFSNAALHWMTRPDDVIAGVRRALKPGGRFVGEFGGHGNIETVLRALRKALHKRGIAFNEINPWYFPTVEEYRARLEAQSMDVCMCELIPRPTRLSTHIVNWLKVFARRFLDVIPETEHEAFLREVSTYCMGELRNSDGHWILDYVRLRFAAVKQ